MAVAGTINNQRADKLNVLPNKLGQFVGTAPIVLFWTPLSEPWNDRRYAFDTLQPLADFPLFRKTAHAASRSFVLRMLSK